jgi:hypothetical protein
MAKANIGSLNKTLVNADYINLPWKNANFLRNNTKIPAEASKEVALEVNVDTVKYSFIQQWLYIPLLGPDTTFQFYNPLLIR